MFHKYPDICLYEHMYVRIEWRRSCIWHGRELQGALPSGQRPLKWWPPFPVGKIVGKFRWVSRMRGRVSSTVYRRIFAAIRPPMRQKPTRIIPFNNKLWRKRRDAFSPELSGELYRALAPSLYTPTPPKIHPPHENLRLSAGSNGPLDQS